MESQFSNSPSRCVSPLQLVKRKKYHFRVPSEKRRKLRVPKHYYLLDRKKTTPSILIKRVVKDTLKLDQ